MVSPIENRTQIDGMVSSRAPHESVGKWDLLRVQVSDTAPVAGYPDLLSNQLSTAPTSELTIAADRSELPDGDLSGWRFRGQATLAGPGVVRAVTAGTAVQLDPPPAAPQ